MRRRLLALLAVVLTFGAVASACGSDDDGSSEVKAAFEIGRAHV